VSSDWLLLRALLIIGEPVNCSRSKMPSREIDSAFFISCYTGLSATIGDREQNFL